MSILLRQWPQRIFNSELLGFVMMTVRRARQLVLEEKIQAQSKIFTKFFRADNVKVVDPDGTGLGLYIVKQIIAQMKGKIRFESEEGKGTVFYIELPLNEV